MECAAALLSDGHPVGVSARAAGYKDEFNFSKAFKKVLRLISHSVQKNIHQQFAIKEQKLEKSLRFTEVRRKSLMFDEKRYAFRLFFRLFFYREDYIIIIQRLRKNVGEGTANYGKFDRTK